MASHRYSEFNGFHGILAGLLVAVKQIMPDHEVILAGLFKLKARVRAQHKHQPG